MSTSRDPGDPGDEGRIADYLRQTPEFFERHADVLAHITLVDPHQGHAVSLQGRQATILRERVRALELQISDLVRAGRANDDLSQRLSRWTAAVLAEPSRARLADVALEALRRHFEIPHSALRLWTEQARPPDEPSRLLADSMHAPYVGPQAGFAPATWLGAAGAEVRSIALVTLRRPGQARSFGLLVMGSPDASRFETGMGTNLLARVGEMLSAALAPGAAGEGDRRE
jgi:uncharacterized protein YigA (DUF484 family)